MPDWRIALVQNNISFRRHQRLFHRIVDDIEFIPPSINDMEVHILRTISVSIIYVQPRITPCMGLRRQQAAEERPVPIRVRRNPPRHRVTRPLRAQARTRQTPQRRGHVPRPQEMQRTVLHAQERHPLRIQGPTTDRPAQRPATGKRPPAAPGNRHGKTTRRTTKQA